MDKLEPSNMLHLTISQSDGIPLYLQLVQQIKRQIATGRLTPDSELPPVRVLAQQLVINPNTVVRAYRELENAGLIYKRRGAGTYVAHPETPFSDREVRRLLSERVDGLLIEARSLGYDLKQLEALLRERDQALDTHEQSGKGE